MFRIYDHLLKLQTYLCTVRNEISGFLFVLFSVGSSRSSGASRQLQGCHRAGIPDGMHHTGADLCSGSVVTAYDSEIQPPGFES